MAHAGFTLMAETLWKSSILCLNELPKFWLSDIINEIKLGAKSEKLCFTRRSAGVPFFVQVKVSDENIFYTFPISFKRPF